MTNLKTFSIITGLLFFFNAGNGIVYSQDAFYDDQDLKIDFDVSVQKYLDEKVDKVYSEMDNKYMLLSYMARSINRELKHRGKKLDVEEIVINKKIGNSRKMIAEYKNELNRIRRIYLDLEDLQKNPDSNEESEKIEQLHDSIVSAFDHPWVVSDAPAAKLEGEATLDKFLYEWKAHHYTEYEILFTKYRIIRKALIKHGTVNEKARMLEIDLIAAFKNFLDENHDLALLQLTLILEDYEDHFQEFDQVVYYRGESYYAQQQFDDAKNDYHTVVTKYPASQFFENSIFRLLDITYKLGELSEFYDYYRIFKSQQENFSSEFRNRCNYLAGYVFLMNSQFSAAYGALSNINADSPYYLKAQFLLGTVLVNQKQMEEAVTLFDEIIEFENRLDPELPYYQDSARLKKGFIQYDQGEFEKALETFNNISSEFMDYDKCLLGKAWTNLKLENHQEAIGNANLIIENHLSSDHIYEASILAAFSKNILDEDVSAKSDLEYVSNAEPVYELAEKYESERRVILKHLYRLKQMEEPILARRDEASYKKLTQIHSHLEQLLTLASYRLTHTALAIDKYSTERRAIIDQIEELDQMVIDAHGQSDKKTMLAANKQRERLLKTLDVYQSDKSIKNVNNYLDYPVVAKEGNANYRKRSLSELWTELKQEHRALKNNLQEIQKIRSDITENNKGRISTVDIEFLAHDFERLSNEIRQMQATLSENQVADVNTEYAQWADYSAFGISDFMFTSILETDEQIAQLALNISAITQILQDRKNLIEQKLLQYEEQIKMIEQDRLKQETIQKKESKESYFQDSYFDKSEREYETEEPTPNE